MTLAHPQHRPDWGNKATELDGGSLCVCLCVAVLCIWPYSVYLAHECVRANNRSHTATFFLFRAAAAFPIRPDRDPASD